MKRDQKGFAHLGIAVVLVVVLGITFVGWRMYQNQSGRDEPLVAQTNETKDEVLECVDKPMTGRVIFDVSQPAPFADPRVNEIRKSINASYLTWRDGSIIKIDGKDYSSGKYFATIEEGSEETALAILNSNPHVTFASNISRCQGKPKVIVD